jgi:hypothetical protein
MQHLKPISVRVASFENMVNNDIYAHKREPKLHVTNRLMRIPNKKNCTACFLEQH